MSSNTSHVVNLPIGISSTDEINEQGAHQFTDEWARPHWKKEKETKELKEYEADDSDKYLTKNAASYFLSGFNKTAGGPGSGVSHPNASTIDFLQTSPIMSIGYRQKFMDTHKPVSTSVKIPTNKIKYKGQEKMVPKKLVKMIKIWDKVKDKPIDVIVDSAGYYHILDGHHRALAAILTKVKTIVANVYKAPKELE